jgi:hypothetical protein
MRWRNTVYAAFCAAISVAIVRAQSDTNSTEPVYAVVDQFLTKCLRSAEAGIPTEEKTREFAPYFSDRLVKELAIARRREQEYIVKTDGKSPFAGANFFPSRDVGGTFELLGATQNGRTAKVKVSLRNNQDGESLETILLIAEKGRWKVDDIQYLSSDGKVVDSLRKELNSDVY